MTVVVEEGRQRARRSDAGTVRLSERDIQALTWLADMKAIYETDLRILFSRFSGRMLGLEAVRAVIRRWERAGYAKAQKLLVGQPRMVWLRPPGAVIVGEENWRETAAHTAIHTAEVARVRLWLEGRENPAGSVVEWESERRYRQWAAEKFKDGSRGMHVPDGIATFSEGIKAAIEVERSEKQRSRLTNIVERLTTAHHLTIYAIPKGETEEQRIRTQALKRQILTAYEDVKAAKRTLRTMDLVVVEYPAQLV